MVIANIRAPIARRHQIIFLLALTTSVACGFLTHSSRSIAKTFHTSSSPISMAKNDDSAPFSAGKISRRQASFSIFPFSHTGVLLPTPSEAFPNKISNKYDDRPKRRGPQPKDLGILKRKDMLGGEEDYDGLKNCGGAPNCFCSTDSKEYDPDHYIPPWFWPKGYDQETAFLELETVIKAYEPGQGGIDGGGFAVQKSDPSKGYLYIKFEALKNGYIDDVEFAVLGGTAEREVQVRSSSRVGYLDYGVNAKRLNYIAKALDEKGWNSPGVDFNTHPDYAIQNGIL